MNRIALLLFVFCLSGPVLAEAEPWFSPESWLIHYVASGQTEKAKKVIEGMSRWDLYLFTFDVRNELDAVRWQPDEMTDQRLAVWGWLHDLQDGFRSGQTFVRLLSSDRERMAKLEAAPEENLEDAILFANANATNTNLAPLVTSWLATNPRSEDLVELERVFKTTGEKFSLPALRAELKKRGGVYRHTAMWNTQRILQAQDLSAALTAWEGYNEKVKADSELRALLLRTLNHETNYSANEESKRWVQAIIELPLAPMGGDRFVAEYGAQALRNLERQDMPQERDAFIQLFIRFALNKAPTKDDVPPLLVDTWNKIGSAAEYRLLREAFVAGMVAQQPDTSSNSHLTLALLVAEASTTRNLDKLLEYLAAVLGNPEMRSRDIRTAIDRTLSAALTEHQRKQVLAKLVDLETGQWTQVRAPLRSVIETAQALENAQVIQASLQTALSDNSIPERGEVIATAVQALAQLELWETLRQQEDAVALTLQTLVSPQPQRTTGAFVRAHLENEDTAAAVNAVFRALRRGVDFEPRAADGSADLIASEAFRVGFPTELKSILALEVDDDLSLPPRERAQRRRNQAAVHASLRLLRTMMSSETDGQLASDARKAFEAADPTAAQRVMVLRQDRRTLRSRKGSEVLAALDSQVALVPTEDAHEFVSLYVDALAASNSIRRNEMNKALRFVKQHGSHLSQQELQKLLDALSKKRQVHQAVSIAEQTLRSETARKGQRDVAIKILGQAVRENQLPAKSKAKILEGRIVPGLLNGRIPPDQAGHALQSLMSDEDLLNKFVTTFVDQQTKSPNLRRIDAYATVLARNHPTEFYPLTKQLVETGTHDPRTVKTHLNILRTLGDREAEALAVLTPPEGLDTQWEKQFRMQRLRLLVETEQIDAFHTEAQAFIDLQPDDKRKTYETSAVFHELARRQKYLDSLEYIHTALPFEKSRRSKGLHSVAFAGGLG